MIWKLENNKELLSSLRDRPGSLNLRSDKYTCLDVELRRNSVNDTERLLGLDWPLIEEIKQNILTDWIKQKNEQVRYHPPPSLDITLI